MSRRRLPAAEVVAARRRRSALRDARRAFLTSCGHGFGSIALASLLADDATASGRDRGEANRRPHFAPRAKRCIFVFFAGAPSQLDLYDDKPELRRRHLQPLPDSFTKGVRFAFIQKDSAVLMGSPRTFRRYGECGMELSELLPHVGACADKIALVRSMHTDQFNHHPGQLMMNTGFPLFGRPSAGAWLNWGLGSPSRNLPGYVVLTSGRGTSAGTSNWTSGFLPSSYEGVLFRSRGEPVLHLDDPPGVTRQLQRDSLDALGALNRLAAERVRDPEIASRIATYELAFRMQAAAPELIDFRDEPAHVRELYGVDRDEGGMRNYENRGAGEFAAFSRNCLLARRLVERGVRFVNIYHATWDHHVNIDAGLDFNCRMADQPLAALLVDLEQRGLLDDTLVVCAGEFGRTPLGENRVGRQPNTGRDHHPFAFSAWLAGGGIRGGQVLGATDELGWNVVADPVHVHDLHATMLHLFGLDHERLTYRYEGRDMRLTDVAGRVVRELLA